MDRGFTAEALEVRVLLSSAFNITQLTNMRADPNFSGINGSGIGIAVLDTGVYAQNPDLQPNIAAYYDAVENPVSTPPDPNFLVDAVDHVGHGSHVSGIAAASDPNIGVAYDAKLIEVRVFADAGENQLPGDPILRGLQWVAQEASTYNIKVVNMSLGTPGVNINFTPALDQEGLEIQTLESMGITVVSSTGNSYAVDPVPGASLPAAESTISVANSFPDNGVGQYNFSGFSGEAGDQWLANQPSAYPDDFNATSQRSSLFNQLVAPGTDIFSTWNSPAQLFNTLSGTSMSAPFVSGTVALMQQAAQQFGGVSLQPSEVLQILRNTADQITDPVNSANVRAEIQADGSLGPPQPLLGTGLTYDRVNVYKAIQAVKAFVQGNTGFGGDQNNVIADATPLPTLNGVNTDTVSGDVGTDGAVLVGDNDIDLYSFNIAAGGNLTVGLAPVPNGITFNATLRLFDSTGNQIQTATGSNGQFPSFGTLPGQPLALGTYYVGVSSAGNDTYDIVNGSGIGGGTSQGAYQLTIALGNPDPHGTTASANVLALTEPNTLLPNSSLGNVPASEITGTIGVETNSAGQTIDFPDGDVQFYQVVAPDTGELIIQADADVAVFDSTNTLIGSEGSNLTVPVTIGNIYYIGVTTQANAGFDPVNPFNRTPGSTPPTPYTMIVAFSNGDRNGTIAQATLSTLGTGISGNIGTDSGITIGANGSKDVDFYSFVMPSAGVFESGATGSGGFVPQMSLWTSNNGITNVQQLGNNYGTGGALMEQVTAGQVVDVAITGQNNTSFNGVTDGSGAGGTTGNYTLSTQLEPVSVLQTISNNSIKNNTPTVLTLNQAISADLGVDGDLIIGPNDIDIYSFTAPTAAQYQFATNTSQDGDAQTVMRVFDSNGNQVAANESANSTSTNSVVSVPMNAGQTYYIGISGVGPNAFTYNPLDGTNTGPGSTGPYSITATELGPFQRTATIQQGQKATYTDASGHKITVTLNGPGLGTLIFLSSAQGADVDQIVVNGTDSTSSLSVTGQSTNLPSVVINGSLRSFTAPTDNLTGDMTVSGSLGTLRLATASGDHSITVGSGGKLNATFTTLTDESLISAEAIGTLRASNWTISAGLPRQQISAPSIASLNVTGTFDEDVNVTTLGNMSVGTLTSSAIRAANSINSFSAGSTVNSEIFAGVQTNVTTLPAAPTDFANTASVFKSLTVRGAFSNTMIAGWTMTNVTLNDVQTNNGGKPFGITANSIKHVKSTAPGAKTIVLTNIFAPLAAQPLGGDATIRIIG